MTNFPMRDGAGFSGFDSNASIAAQRFSACTGPALLTRSICKAG
jgi:hypothetical protein